MAKLEQARSILTEATNKMNARLVSTIDFTLQESGAPYNTKNKLPPTKKHSVGTIHGLTFVGGQVTAPDTIVSSNLILNYEKASKYPWHGFSCIIHQPNGFPIESLYITVTFIDGSETILRANPKRTVGQLFLSSSVPMTSLYITESDASKSDFHMKHPEMIQSRFPISKQVVHQAHQQAQPQQQQQKPVQTRVAPQQQQQQQQQKHERPALDDVPAHKKPKRDRANENDQKDQKKGEQEKEKDDNAQAEGEGEGQGEKEDEFQPGLRSYSASATSASSSSSASPAAASFSFAKHSQVKLRPAAAAAACHAVSSADAYDEDDDHSSQVSNHKDTAPFKINAEMKPIGFYVLNESYAFLYRSSNELESLSSKVFGLKTREDVDLSKTDSGEDASLKCQHTTISPQGIVNITGGVLVKDKEAKGKQRIAVARSTYQDLAINVLKPKCHAISFRVSKSTFRPFQNDDEKVEVTLRLYPQGCLMFTVQQADHITLFSPNVSMGVISLSSDSPDLFVSDIVTYRS